jgi:hypothetical protein
MEAKAQANPWVCLPSAPPYILPEDVELIKEFNLSAKEKYQVRWDISPEPFLGNPNAPVVLLSGNPGYNDKDPEWHGDPTFATRSRGNLLHRQSDYPFYLLDPTIKRTAYWEKGLKRLIALSEDSGQRLVANRVLCVEFFPYHSKRFKHGKLRLPSQDYSFGLVKQAVQRNAVILLLRCRKLWFAAVPELSSYPRCYVARSWQNSAISPRNFGDGFEMALNATCLNLMRSAEIPM